MQDSAFSLTHMVKPHINRVTDALLPRYTLNSRLNDRALDVGWWTKATPLGISPATQAIHLYLISRISD